MRHPSHATLDFPLFPWCSRTGVFAVAHYVRPCAGSLRYSVGLVCLSSGAITRTLVSFKVRIFICSDARVGYPSRVGSLSLTTVFGAFGAQASPVASRWPRARPWFMCAS